MTALLLIIMCTLVTHIVDGDTVQVDHARVRVLGIDCPESKPNAKCRRDTQHPCKWHVPRGKAATARAKELLTNATVTLECGPTCKTGPYNRALRYIRLQDGSDYGLILINEGLCVDYTKYPHARTQQYVAAQRQAQQAKVGIWK